MKNIKALIGNDFKNIFRDEILKIMFFIPFVMIIILHFGLPWLVSALPLIADYQFLIITMICLVIASFPAFLFSFVMLDEKDEGIFVMYRVLPVSVTRFFMYRLGFLMVFSWFFSLLVLVTSGPSGMHLWQKAAASVLFAMLPPVITLLSVTFARNKVEGVTIMKLSNFLLFLPVAAFFIPQGWKFVFGVIPPFWTYMIMETVNDHLFFSLTLVAGICVHLVTISLLFRLFLKKV